MAGIDTLLRGAATTFAKDKVSPFLTPMQRDFLALILSPQGYLLDTGINAAANALGYGSQYRELKGGAKDNEDYYKEVMRDSIGDMLPDTVGDFVRATPRISEADSQPAGVYTAFDPDTETYVQQGSSNPVASSDPFAGDRFSGKYDQDSVFNTNSQNYVGPANPKDMDSSIYSSNLTDLLSMLDEYRAAEVPETVITASKETAPEGYTFDNETGLNVPVGDQTVTETPIDFGGTMDYSDIFGGDYNYYGGFDTSRDFGGGGGNSGGGKFYDDFSSMAMAKGGRVRGCNC
jgi:hypothetical protein